MPRTPSTRLSTLVALVFALCALTTPALAQDDTSTTSTPDCPPESSSSSTSSTSSTTPGTPDPCATTTTAPSPTAPPSSPLPPPPGGEQPPPPPEDPAPEDPAPEDTDPPEHAGDQDSPPESVPLSEETIPPPPGEPVDPLAAERLIRRELRVAQAEVLQSAAEVEAAATLVDELADRLADLQQELAHLDVAQQLKVQELEDAQVRFRERIANAVVRGNAAELDTVMTSQDGTVLEMRKVFLASVSEADSRSVADLVQAKAVIDQGVLDAVDAVARTRRELRGARQALQDSLRINTERKFQLAVFSAGSEIVIRGFVFPVGEPFSFIDSWGYPRMVGTEYEHGHQGVDIMAPFDTPLYAVERGIITRLGTDVLGGTKLWLKGQSGTYYYYAHLASYAEGMAEGAVVSAGDVVGYVGDTGNAQGGAPHLHFQVHPGGGEAVNPYGLLRVVADLSRR
ncbi:peptidoglycan DD-metalloendopeptidase family protein [Acidimicrobiia bacterium EGI L10123]|uniref:peptidoglycan DD-metalloendopeptidase family protein n=1 Tax=Salinilacustrithrix flava TaxID=2957203 RepID=UPI003D7C2C85|nr:peptidoglycan DD-metalloendopeptidase family protein [Acidimicrobiia bacterium EGI L10123]